MRSILKIVHDWSGTIYTCHDTVTNTESEHTTWEAVLIDEFWAACERAPKPSKPATEIDLSTLHHLGHVIVRRDGSHTYAVYKQEDPHSYEPIRLYHAMKHDSLHVCPKCVYAYTEASDLTAHIKKKHPMAPSVTGMAPLQRTAWYEIRHWALQCNYFRIKTLYEIEWLGYEQKICNKSKRPFHHVFVRFLDKRRPSPTNLKQIGLMFSTTKSTATPLRNGQQSEVLQRRIPHLTIIGAREPEHDRNMPTHSETQNNTCKWYIREREPHVPMLITVP